jgi:hypothetical protein
MDWTLAARFDLGFGNPNTTAALITCITLAALAPVLLNHRLWWLSCPTVGLGLLGLVATASRGGFVSLVGGIGVILFFRRKEVGDWLRQQSLLFWGLASILALLIVFAFIVSGSRFSRWNDGSVVNRWTMYRSIPSMIAAAPGGWGWGNAADAWHNWFQPIERHEAYKNLLSTHSTWCVEGGWLFATGYVSLFTAGLIVCCWPRSEQTGSACDGLERLHQSGVPASMWSAFAISATTTHIGWSLVIWILPVAAVVLSLRVFLRDTRKKAKRVAMSLALVTGALMPLICVFIASNSNTIPIHRRVNGDVIVGKGSPTVALVAADRRVDGGRPGKLARKWALTQRDSLIVTTTPSHPGDDAIEEMWVLGRSAGHAPPGVRRLFWINPPGTQEAVAFAARANQAGSEVIVYWGRHRSTSQATWDSWHGEIRLLQNAGDYVDAIPSDSSHEAVAIP